MRSLARSPSPDTPSPVPGDIGTSASERAKDLVGRTKPGDPMQATATTREGTTSEAETSEAETSAGGVDDRERK